MESKRVAGELLALSVAMALAESHLTKEKTIELKYEPMPNFDFTGFFPAKPSKFIPSKGNQPWKRNRK